MKNKYSLLIILFGIFKITTAQTTAIPNLTVRDVTSSNNFIFVSDGSNNIFRYDTNNLSSSQITVTNDASPFNLSTVANGSRIVYTKQNGITIQLKQVPTTGSLPASNTLINPINQGNISAGEVVDSNAGVIYTTEDLNGGTNHKIINFPTYQFFANAQVTDLAVDGNTLFYCTGINLYSRSINSATATSQLLATGDIYTLAFGNGKLYYAARNSRQIDRMNPDGTSIENVYTDSSSGPIISSMAVVNENVYFIENSGSDLLTLIDPNEVSCTPVQNLTTGTITTNSISVNWDLESDPNTTYRVAAIPVGFNGTNTFINSNINTYNFTGLTPNTDYNVTITKVCSDGTTVDTVITATTGIATTVIYVNKNATGSNNGNDWSNAFTELRDAIAVATGKQ
ncbi:hypothetical protein JCM19275_942 [Nonlabens ulvanivorans]|uniref:Fibronectin type-III domain-containing protein n=1 Tax=Nonlabens ulvanivorans TaxID=906888 RepID=A0A090WFC1_NONUL|nr:fibronectin type III domain-containing protein [Nonlabens ulvanivorans]GAL74903.1 hypothetical protein JCM19275_942 [Nonlabens ulvanivorans]